jgi:hypothetical protein
MPKYVSYDNEYYTPKEIVARFGHFDYDPATTPEKAAEFGIKSFDTIETDGLTKDWTKYRRIWCNPPFTRKHEFLAKACETYRKTHADIYFLFPVEFTTTKRFHEALGELGGGALLAKWKNQVRVWAWKMRKVSELRNSCVQSA